MKNLIVCFYIFIFSACASQTMDVSSKEVRIAIMSKLNIASKIEKMKKIKKQL